MRHLLPLMFISAASAADFDPQSLTRLFPNARIASVQAAAVDPWLEVVLEDGQVVYATPDGGHLMVGDLVDVDGQVNLTEQRREQARSDLIDERLPAELFEYPAPNGEKWVTVVTDVDCPYCRRLHQQMDDYHARGISVRYLMLPRAGLSSGSYRKAVSAACADQPEDALTRLMNNQDIESAECDSSIEAQFALARALRVTGTPAIITDRGRMIPGYLPPARLAMELGLADTED